MKPRYMKATEPVAVDPHTSKPGEGLTYPYFVGRLREDCNGEGWDVVDVMRDEPDKEASEREVISVYSFSVRPRFSKYTTTEYNRAQRLLRKQKDIYGRLRSYAESHAWLLDTLQKELYETRDYQKAKPAAREYLRGWRDATHDALYYRELEWRVFSRPLNRLVTRAESDAPGFDWSTCDPDKGAFVWKHAPERRW